MGSSGATPGAGGGVGASPVPAMYGLAAWSFDPVIANAWTAPAAGVLQVVRICVCVASTVQNLMLFVEVAGSGLTVGQNKAALYDDSFNLVDVTASQHTEWQSAGVKSMPLSGGLVMLGAGYYYVGWWCNGSTRPSFARAGGLGIVNLSMVTPQIRFATADSGVTATAPDPFAAPTAASDAYWVGLS